MRTYVILVLIAMLALMPGTPTAAQEGDGVTTVEIGGVSTETFPQVTALINVFDAFGVPVPDLTADDFAVTIDGAPVEIAALQSITQDSLPISVVLVIDSSESMLNNPLAAAQQAALAFIDNLRPGDQVALIDFDSTARVVRDFTTNFDAVRAAINDLVANGQTALYQASYEAAQLAAQSENTRRYVVLLTDGNEYGGLSTAGPQEAIALAQQSNIAFYTFGLGFGVEGSYLNRLATETRGEFYFLPDASTLEEAYAFLAAYLRTQYVITLDTGLEPDGSTHEVSVAVEGQRASATFTAPDRYPEVTFEGVPEGPISEPVTFTAQVSAERGLGTNQVTLDGETLDVPFTPGADNTASAEITIDPYTLTPGEHTLTLRAVDAAGGFREATAPIAVEALPPEFTLEGLDEGAFISEDSVTLSITPERAQQPIEHVTITIDDEPVVEFTGAPFTTTIDLLPFGPGTHRLAVTVEDASGQATITRDFALNPALFVTPSPTPTNTSTPTPTFTPSNTPTNTPTLTPTLTSTPAPTFTPTPRPTNTPDATGTAIRAGLILTTTAESWTATPAPTDTPRPTRTPAPTNTPADTATPAPTDTPADTDTPQPSDTPVDTDTPEPTDTPQPTDTPAPSATPTVTNTPEPTDTPLPSATPTMTNTPEPTDTPLPSATPTMTNTPEPTDTPLPSATPTMTNTPEPTDTPLPSATPTVTNTPEPTDTPLPSETPTPTETPVPSDTPTLTPDASATAAMAAAIAQTMTAESWTDTPEPSETPNATATALEVALQLTSTAESWTETPTSTITPSLTPTPLPSETPEPSETAPPSETPTPSDTPEPSVTPTPEPSDTSEPTETSTPSVTPVESATPRPTATATPIQELVEVGDDDAGASTMEIALLCGGFLLVLGVLVYVVWRFMARGASRG